MTADSSYSSLQMGGGNVSDSSSTSLGAKAGSVSSLDSTGSDSPSPPASGDAASDHRESPDEAGISPESTSFKTPNLPEFSSFKMPKTYDSPYILSVMGRKMPFMINYSILQISLENADCINESYCSVNKRNFRLNFLYYYVIIPFFI